MQRKVWKGLAVLLAMLFALVSCDDGSGGGSDPTSISYAGNAGGKTYTLTISKGASKAVFTPKVHDHYILKIKKDGEAEKTSSGYVLFIVPAGAGGGSTYTLQPTATPPGEPAGTTAPTFDVTVNNTNGITSIDASDTDGDGMADDTKITLDGAQGEDDPPGHVNPGGEVYIKVNIGDRGPGGGIIFYVFPGDGLDMGDGYICQYLEVAPVALGPFAWISDDFYVENPENPGYFYWDYNAANVPDTEYGIGAGLKNTSLILEVDENAPAASACFDWENNGFNDWFLPSPEEFYELGTVISRNFITHPARYLPCWTSAQDHDDNRNAISWSMYELVDKLSFNSTSKPSKTHHYVVPIRGVMLSDFKW